MCWIMAVAGGDTRRVDPHQHGGDAAITFGTEEMVRVEQLESKTDDGRDGAQRDVTLRPGEFHAKNTLALILAPADDAMVDHGGGIGTGFRAGEGETRHLSPIGKTWQIMLL